MMPFIQMPYRRPGEVASRGELRPWLVALILALIVCLQVGLVLWVFINQWRA